MRTVRLRPVVILDLETGGLDPETDAILEVAACRYVETEDGSELLPQYWHEWFLPNGNVSDDALKVNGLTSAKLNALGARRNFNCAIETFLHWCAEPFLPGGKILWCGHNVHFDLAFLHHTAKRLGIAFPFSDSHLLDTGALAAACFVNSRVRAMSLDLLTGKCRATHSAMDDVFACREFLNSFMHEFGLTNPENGYIE